MKSLRLDSDDYTHYPMVIYCNKATLNYWRDWRQMMTDRWLSVDEIADHLGIKRDTVCRWISERQMPGPKVSRL